MCTDNALPPNPPPSLPCYLCFNFSFLIHTAPQTNERREGERDIGSELCFKATRRDGRGRKTTIVPAWHPVVFLVCLPYITSVVVCVCAPIIIVLCCLLSNNMVKRSQWDVKYTRLFLELLYCVSHTVTLVIREIFYKECDTSWNKRNITPICYYVMNCQLNIALVHVQALSYGPLRQDSRQQARSRWPLNFTRTILVFFMLR